MKGINKILSIALSAVMILNLSVGIVRGDGGEIIGEDKIAATYAMDYDFAQRAGQSSEGKQIVHLGEPVDFATVLEEQNGTNQSDKSVKIFAFVEPAGEGQMTDFEYKDGNEWKDASVFQGMTVPIKNNKWNFRVTFQKEGVYKFCAFATDEKGKQVLWSNPDEFPMIQGYIVIEEGKVPFKMAQSDAVQQFGEDEITLTQAKISTYVAPYIQQETTQEATTQEVTTQEATSQQSTTENVTTQQVTTQEATSQQSTTESVTTQQGTTENVTTQQVTTQEATTQQNTTESVTTQQVTTQEATSQQSTTESVTTQEATTQEITTNQATTNQVTTAKVQPTENKDVVVGKTKVKKATKKSNKVKISLKKINNAKGYQVYFSKKKSFKKKNIIAKINIVKAKLVKKAKFTIKNKKFKKFKKIWVKVRAYSVVNGKNTYGKWSKIKKIK